MSEKSTVQKASMPKGTVTFLFTDIEGSTQLWERHFAVMREDLEQHDRLIRAVVGSNGGYIFKTGGDAFHCAFESAPRALSAALQTQKAVAAHQWRVPGGLRVRMALHTGVSEEREEDYFGPTPNRTARLRETAWGGQTFLSQATAALVQDYLPEGASLILRGEHRLKDLLRPEMIYQLHHPELPSDPRKPKSLTVLPNNLPVIGRHLVGRVRELEQIKEALAKTRILTLHAGGGFGKTRLALQVGADLLDTFEHGVWLANIPSTSPEMLPQMVAQVVNVPFLPREDPLGALLFHLEAKNLLLILDGCEHAVDACGALAHKLLSACAGVRILTASQESLNIRDELVWSVPPLSYPSADEAVTLTRVREFDAVQFFYDQASLSNPSFRPTKDNLSWVARICHRFKGVPLHLELAALWVDTLSVQEILSRSAEPYGLLQRGRSDAPARQQSLLASVEWSFRLLDEHERALFNRMSVFQGSCDSEAVEEVCLEEDVERGQVPHLLSRLVKKSFVQTVENPALVMRYRLADTLRMFGEKQLEAAHGLEVLRERHARYFLEFAQKAREGLSSKESRAWLMRLDQDHLNLLSALDWFLDRSNAESALRMVRGLSRFWEIRSYWAQGVQAIENALRLPGALEHPSPRAYALNAAGSLLRLQGAFDKSHAYHSESLALYQELGDQRQKAGVVNNLANLEHDQDHYAEAHRLYSESLAVWRELGDELGIAEVLHNLGSVTRDQGNYAEARERWEEILDIWQRTESKERLAQTLNDLGDLDQQQGKYDSARMRLHSSRRIFRELGNALGVAFATMNLGNLALDQGEFREARRLYRQAARRLDRLGDNKRWLGRVKISLGNVALAEEKLDEARGLYQEALGSLRDSNDTLGVAVALMSLGNVARDKGDLDDASARHNEALAIYKRLGHQRAVATGLINLGNVALDRDSYSEARSHYAGSLEIFQAMGAKLEIILCLERFAKLAIKQQEYVRALRLFSAATAQRRVIGAPLQPADGKDYDKDIAAVGEMLGGEKSSASQVAGERMTLEEAVPYALARD